MNEILKPELFRVPGIEAEKVPLDVTLEHLPAELRIKATEQMLDLMQEVLSGLDNYAIFASTGMYLQGQRIGDRNMTVPPGDLDVAVANKEALREIAKRLSKVRGIIFDHGGITRPFPGQDAEALAGKILMTVDEQTIEYPFEFFHEKRIVDDKVFRYREKLRDRGGLSVLTVEGLKQQYLHNLEFDSRVAKASEEVAGYLARHEDTLQEAMAGRQGREMLDVVLKTYDITEDQLKRFYEISEAMPSADGAARDKLKSEQSRILGGVKTKVAKRLLNVQQLDKHMAITSNLER